MKGIKIKCKDNDNDPTTVNDMFRICMGMFWVQNSLFLRKHVQTLPSFTSQHPLQDHLTRPMVPLGCRQLHDRFWQRRMLLALEIHAKHPMHPTRPQSKSGKPGKALGLEGRWAIPERFYLVESNFTGLWFTAMFHFGSVEQ